MGTLKVRLFGGFEIQHDGQPLLQPASRRVRDLLCYLLLNRDRPQSRDHLAGQLWENFTESQARRCLNTTLWRLQGALAEKSARPTPYLHVDAQSICVAMGNDLWLDVAEFEALCASASQLDNGALHLRAALFRQAVALYTDDLLLDCFENWCLVERQRLQQLNLNGLFWLISYHSERGEAEAAIAYGRRILAFDSYREETHRDLIQLFLATGQRASALRQYLDFETAMRSDLGISLAPEMQAILEGIIGESVPAERPGPAISRATGTETGRRHAYDELRAALALMREAGGALDGAKTQLSNAAALLEDAAHQLDGGSGWSEITVAGTVKLRFATQSRA